MAFIKVFLTISQVFLSIALVAAVLLHSAKGEGLAGIGGQAHMFGSQKGVEAGLNRITTIIAVIWFLVAVGLALMGRTSGLV
jgi:preprotein translocase subunit SecG